MKNAIEILDGAIETEKEGQIFYREAAQGVKHREAKGMFLSLAEDEKEHEDILLAQKRSLLEHERWLPYKAPSRKGAPAPTPIFSLEDIKDANIYRSHLSTLKLGIDLEKKSRDYYLKAKGNCQDPSGRVVFQELANWEEEHQSILEREYSFLLGDYKRDMGFEPF